MGLGWVCISPLKSSNAMVEIYGFPVKRARVQSFLCLSRFSQTGRRQVADVSGPLTASFAQSDQTLLRKDRIAERKNARRRFASASTSNHGKETFLLSLHFPSSIALFHPDTACGTLYAPYESSLGTGSGSPGASPTVSPTFSTAASFARWNSLG
jgi:hypothetical protein